MTHIRSRIGPHILPEGCLLVEVLELLDERPIGKVGAELPLGNLLDQRPCPVGALGGGQQCLGADGFRESDQAKGASTVVIPEGGCDRESARSQAAVSS